MQQRLSVLEPSIFLYPIGINEALKYLRCARITL